MNIVLLGPPGAGKGTQGERIAQPLGIPKLATGDVLRAAVSRGHAAGPRGQVAMERGDLVPDSVILGIMKDALAEPRDGEGRRARRRRAHRAAGRGARARARASSDGSVDAVLLFDVDDEELVRRLSARTVCEGCQTPYTGREPGTACDKCGGKLVRRKDDEPEAIRTRMRAYHEQTAPVLDWYARTARESPRSRGQNACSDVRVCALGDIDDITNTVMKGLGR